MGKEPKKIKNRLAEWAEFFEIAMKYKAVSLGQGTPGWAPPKFLREEWVKTINEGQN